MAHLKVKTEHLPIRCDICHQTDKFSPTQNYCERCNVFYPIKQTSYLNKLERLLLKPYKLVNIKSLEKVPFFLLLFIGTVICLSVVGVIAIFFIMIALLIMSGSFEAFIFTFVVITVFLTCLIIFFILCKNAIEAEN